MTIESEILYAWLKFSAPPFKTYTIHPNVLPWEIPCPIPESIPGLLGSIDFGLNCGEYRAEILFRFPHDYIIKDEISRIIVDGFPELGWETLSDYDLRRQEVLLNLQSEAGEYISTYANLNQSQLILIHRTSETIGHLESIQNGDQIISRLSLTGGKTYRYYSFLINNSDFYMPSLNPVDFCVVDNISNGFKDSAQGKFLHSTFLLKGATTTAKAYHHYSQQLLSQGWQRRMSTSTSNLSSSSWKVTEKYSGLLNIIQHDARTWQIILSMTYLSSLEINANDNKWFLL